MPPPNFSEAQAILKPCNDASVLTLPFHVGRTVKCGGAAPRDSEPVSPEMERNVNKF